MEKHFTLTDAEFERQFSTTSLDPGLFSHEAHIRLAWIHITKYGVDKAIENICSQLEDFTASVGAQYKYNKTVTIAAIRAVYHFTLKSNTNTFVDFISENSRLKNNFRDLIESHYVTNIFKYEQARHDYLEPELLPFD